MVDLQSRGVVTTTTSSTASKLSTVLTASLLRYDAITHPMNFTGSWRRARCLVAASWGLSIAFSAPILLFYETTETEAC